MQSPEELGHVYLTYLTTERRGIVCGPAVGRAEQGTHTARVVGSTPHAATFDEIDGVLLSPGVPCHPSGMAA